jgi:CRP-like cAMP-binding protein
MAKVATDSPKNLLLAALPHKEYERLLPHLKTVSLSVKQVLQEPYQPIRYVYFPENGVITKVVSTADGAKVEVGVVGKEGMTDTFAFMESNISPFKDIVQVAGEARRVDAAVFHAEIKRNWSWNDLLLRYTQAVVCMVSQSAACNCLHTVEKRCCRWLLLAHDRMDSDEFPLTQESIAQMLGIHRQSITEVARSLSRRGLIRYRWGKVTILDRPGLEAAACECYQLIRQQFRFGSPARV